MNKFFICTNAPIPVFKIIQFIKIERYIMFLFYKIIRFFCRFVVKFLMYSPYKISNIIRVKSYKYLFKNMGINVTISNAIHIEAPYNLSLGNRVSIHEFSYINADGGIKIGNYVSIGSHAVLISSTHQHSDKKLNIKEQPITLLPLKIGNNVWIGSRTTILGGLTIGNNVVIGAHSLVTKDIPDNVIAYGSPCKVQKKI